MGSLKITPYRRYLWLAAVVVLALVAACVVEHPALCRSGVLTTFHYDRQGRRVGEDVVEKGQHRMRYEYDERGRQLSERFDVDDDGILESGKVCRHGHGDDALCFDLPYEGNGRYQVREVPEGKGRTRIELDLDDDGRYDAYLLRTVDEHGRLLELAKPSEKVASSGFDRYTYAYDEQGRLVSTTWSPALGRGEHRERSYDEHGRVVRETTRDGRDEVATSAVTSVYDEEGARTASRSWREPDGPWQPGGKATYDAGGRLTARQWRDGAARLRRVYDDEGRLLREETYNDRGACLGFESHEYGDDGLRRRSLHDRDCDGRPDATALYTSRLGDSGELLWQCAKAPLVERLRDRVWRAVFVVGLALSGGDF